MLRGKKRINFLVQFPGPTGTIRRLSRPAPGRNFTCCSGIPGFGRGHGQGQSKYF